MPRRRPSLAPCVLLLPLAGCLASRPCPRPPLPGAALDGYGAAWSALRRGGEEAWEEAHRAALRAAELAPDWIAPRRLLDDWAVRELRGPERLAEYESALRAGTADAAVHYLRGRLRDEHGMEDFERAADLDPRSDWARHGRATLRAREGDARGAVHDELRAVECARSPFERALFTSAAASHMLRLDQPRRARAVLEEGLRRTDLDPSGRSQLAVDLAMIELEGPQPELRRRGIERALGLLGTDVCSAAEVARLSIGLAVGGTAAFAELELALRSRGDAEALRWLPLVAEAARMGALPQSQHPAASRTPELARGNAAAFLEGWLRSLPRQVVAEDGLPRDERLREVACRGLALPELALASTSELAAFGDALIDAGWFDEAAAFADAVAARGGADRALAADLERRSLAGRTAVESFRRLALDVDQHACFDVWLADPTAAPGAPGTGGASPVEDLDGFLRALAPAWARSDAALGAEPAVERLRDELAASPRITYGPFAAIVHPGPRFSEQDERAGLGRRGQAVPGLAERLDRLHRLGIVGRSVFDPLDATLRRVLWVEQRSGEHLGVPWSGTVFWCEGVDLGGRYERLGARVAGAALHEGFWIDVAAVRSAWISLDELRSSFEAGDPARIERALRVRGPLAASRAERRAPQAPLGEERRLWLAVLAERGAGTERLGRIELEELLDLTALHEEGHLCDRARLYPVREHWPAILSLLARSGFDARRLAARMEYRAQLVALIEAEEPRLALAELVGEGNGAGRGVTSHGEAYAQLLEDFLHELDRALERKPEAFPTLDGDRRLVHQLHRLSAAQVRELARGLARREFGGRAALR